MFPGAPAGRPKLQLRADRALAGADGASAIAARRAAQASWNRARVAAWPDSPVSRARPGNGRAGVPGRLPAARRRSRPGGDFSGRRTWPPSSPPAVGVESETVALETVPAAALQLEASSRSGKPPVPGTRRQVGRTTAPGLGGDGAEAPVGGPADPDPGPVCTWCGIGRRGSLRATKGTDQIPPKYAGRRFHHAGRGGHAPALEFVRKYTLTEERHDSERDGYYRRASAEEGIGDEPGLDAQARRDSLADEYLAREPSNRQPLDAPGAAERVHGCGF